MPDMLGSMKRKKEIARIVEERNQATLRAATAVRMAESRATRAEQVREEALSDLAIERSAREAANAESDRLEGDVERMINLYEASCAHLARLQEVLEGRSAQRISTPLARLTGPVSEVHESQK